MEIALDDPLRDDVLALLEEHLREMYATSPACSVHALDPASLTAPEVTFWTVREGGDLLGCGALKAIDSTHGEIKSMRTVTAARRRGVAAQLLDHLVGEGAARGWRRLSLETGSQEYFAPARALYASRGFVACGPFEGYDEDPASTFMTRALT